MSSVLYLPMKVDNSYPSSREAMDPIAELLSQLSGVRRSAGGQLNSSGPSASQLQQLQMQLQLERQHAQAARQQLETARNASRRTNTSSVTTTITQATATANTANTENSPQALHNSQFLLTRLNDPKMSEAERQSMESERADRSLFVQELLLSTLVREESSSSDEDDRGEMADFGAMGCVDIMPLDVAFSVEQPQSFTCPYCGKMGYTETSLQEHVTSEHAETSTEVICPICAALPGGDPNHVTDDFAAHLTLEHRAPRDLDESSGVRHVRRMFHPGRGLGGPRARRSNMHFTSSSTGGLSSSQSSYSPNTPHSN